MSLRVSMPIRRVLAVVAVVVASVAAVAAMVAPVAVPSALADDASPSSSAGASSSSATSSATDYDTWSAVSDAIAKQLDEGLAEYRSGNTSGSTSDFMGAYNKTYVASNLTSVVSESIGSDRQSSQQQAFQTIQSLSYVPGNDAKLADAVAALNKDLADAAATLDGSSDVAKPRDYAAKLQQQIAEDRKKLDAAKKPNPGKGSRSWTDVANEMVPILDNAYQAYEGGDGAKGATLVNEAYYQYYEKLGFEKNVMNAISGSRVSQVEYQFKEIRSSMNKGEDLKATKQLVDGLKEMLLTDAGILDGNGGAQQNGFTKFITSSIGQAFIILIREGLEALLVCAAIIAYLVKSGNRKLVKWIYLGIVAGIAGAGVIAVIFVRAFGGSGPLQEIMEGVCALIATLMLLWTSNWMLNKRSVAAWNDYIRRKTESAVGKAGSALAAGESVNAGMVLSLAMLSFLAVFREGAETVIFYQSIYSMSQDSQGMWIGGIAAAVVLVVIFLIIRFTSVKIPIGPFFLVTSILMAVLVVIFAGGGVHALIEGDLVAGTYLTGVTTNDWLGFYPYVETIVVQAIAAVAVIALFVVGFAKDRRARRTIDAGSAR